MISNNENFEEIKNKIEAILFSYGDFVDIEIIKSLFRETTEEIILKAIDEIIKKFENGYSFKVEFDEIEDFETKTMKKRWKMALNVEYTE